MSSLGWSLREKVYLGSIISKVLPAVVLQRREKENMVMASLDVRDASLTVKQERNTLVHTTGASGTVRSYSLKKVFPGQRDGSLLWYRAITNLLDQSLTWRSTPHILAFFVRNQKMGLAW